MRHLDESTTGILVGISFPTPFRAQEFLTAISGLAASEKLLLKDAVMITADENGRVAVHETIDPTPTRSAVSGAMWIGLFGLVLGGPIGWAAGAAVGAGAGAISAKVVDLGISDEWVDWFRATVEPGSTIVALLVDDVNRDALVAEAERFPGAELVSTSLDADTVHRLRDAIGQVTDTVHTDDEAPSDA